MKIYIKAAVSIENLKKQYGEGIPKNKFRTLVNLDPTADFDANKGGKYCRWIFEMYKKGNLQESDYTNVNDALQMFAKDYKKYPKSDLMQYKSVDEFIEDTHAVGNRELTDKEKKKLLKKQAHHANTEDKEFLVEDDEFEVWTPLTYPGSISLSREGGTKASWCTAYEGNDNWYRNYTSRGPLYIFLNKNNPNEKYQLHFPSDSWYDINDRSLGMERFYKFCSEHPIIGEFFEVKNTDGVLSRVGTILSYDEHATFIRIPDSVTSLPRLKIPDSCTEVELPDSVTVIPDKVFSKSNVVTVIANNLKTIMPNAFRDSAITNIDLSKVTTIGSSSFTNCRHLHTLNLNQSEPLRLGAYAFADNEFELTLTITPNMKLNIDTFKDCPNLTIVWDAEDDSYMFDNIELLICNPNQCPELFAANNGNVDIETV